jgi:hypothetical protein
MARTLPTPHTPVLLSRTAGVPRACARACRASWSPSGPALWLLVVLSSKGGNKSNLVLRSAGRRAPLVPWPASSLPQPLPKSCGLGAHGSEPCSCFRASWFPSSPVEHAQLLRDHGIVVRFVAGCPPDGRPPDPAPALGPRARSGAGGGRGPGRGPAAVPGGQEGGGAGGEGEWAAWVSELDGEAAVYGDFLRLPTHEVTPPPRAPPSIPI